MQNRIYIADADIALLDIEKESMDAIYIDPPYNTSSKFSYNDSRDDWEEFMLPKIEHAKNILTNDGVLYISIDDNKLIELCSLCDRIFGKRNRIAIMIMHQSARSNTKLVNVVHEYVVVYAKNKSKARKMSIPRLKGPERDDIKHIINTVKAAFKKEGRTSAESALKQAKKEYKQQHENSAWLNNYRVIDDNGDILYPKDLSVPGEPNAIDIDDLGIHLEPLTTRRWSSEQKFRDLHAQDKLHYLNGRPYEAHYLRDATDNIMSLLPFWSRQGNEDLKRLGIDGLFDTPKPVELIKMLFECLLTEKDELSVLDFFAGSGTTAQAIYELRKAYPQKKLSYTLVQIDEVMKAGTEPYNKASQFGINPNIADAMEFRIEKVLEQSGQDDNYIVKRLSSNDEPDE